MPQPTQFRPAPAVTVLIRASQGLSSGSFARASVTQGASQGVCSLSRLAMFSVSELLDTRSATPPSAPIFAALPTKLRRRRAVSPRLAARAAPPRRAPTRRPPPTAPPIPPVATVSAPNSTRPRASLPSPVLFSGTQSSGTSSQPASLESYSGLNGF